MKPDQKIMSLIASVDELEDVIELREQMRKAAIHQYQGGGFEQDEFGHKAYGVCSVCGRSEQHWSHETGEKQ